MYICSENFDRQLHIERQRPECGRNIKSFHPIRQRVTSHCSNTQL